MDHIHILFKVHPNKEMKKFINIYKSVNSRLIKKKFPQVKRYEKKCFWQEVFVCLLLEAQQ
ncbi:hypothetical protein CN393_07900 [Bacillus cereus]|nr:hypothetical protein CN393_07900 [Bacillus cereus]